MQTTMSHASAIVDFLKFSSQLKFQERTIKSSEQRFESVADHSWHLSLMAMLVHPHLLTSVDLLKSLKMALVHDLVEAEIGDVPHLVTATDPQVKELKNNYEKQEIEKIRSLAGGTLGDEMYELWHEFEQQETAEAKFVKALDSLEANQQSILCDIEYWDERYYPIALHKADEFCQHEPILRSLNNEIRDRMKKEFEEKGIII